MQILLAFVPLIFIVLLGYLTVYLPWKAKNRKEREEREMQQAQLDEIRNLKEEMKKLNK